jgi:putative FmdB family regulatory protein
VPTLLRPFLFSCKLCPMFKFYDFECGSCSHVFEEMVRGVDGRPDACPQCGQAQEFKKLPSFPALITTIVVDYPGSKQHKAGYTHTHARPAEKADSQVSMYTPKEKK